MNEKNTQVSTEVPVVKENSNVQAPPPSPPPPPPPPPKEGGWSTFAPDRALSLSATHPEIPTLGDSIVFGGPTQAQLASMYAPTVNPSDLSIIDGIMQGMQKKDLFAKYDWGLKKDFKEAELGAQWDMTGNLGAKTWAESYLSQGKGTYDESIGNATSNMTQQGVSGAVGGAAVGAAMLSWIPGIGQVAGGIIGGAIGGTVGAISGAEIDEEFGGIGGVKFKKGKLIRQEEATEAEKAEEQGFTGRMWRGIQKFNNNIENGSLISLATSVAGAFGIGSKEAGIQGIINNTYADSVTTYNERFNQVAKVYQSNEYKNSSGLAAGFHSEFWTDQVASGVGFAASAIGTGFAVGKGLKGIGLVSTGVRGSVIAAETASATAAEVASVSTASVGATGARAVPDIVRELGKTWGKRALNHFVKDVRGFVAEGLSSVASAIPEAALEARGFQDSTFSKYKTRMEALHGRELTKEEETAFKEKLREETDVHFLQNVAILSVSNFVQFGKNIGMRIPGVNKLLSKAGESISHGIDKVFGRAITRETTDQVLSRTLGEVSGRELANLSVGIGNKFQKFMYVGGKTAVKPLTEGTEESLQGFLTGYHTMAMEAQFDPMGKKEVYDRGSAISKSIKHAFLSEEGSKEFWMGALIGGIMGSKVSTKGITVMGIQDNIREEVQRRKDVANINEKITSHRLGALELLGSGQMLNTLNNEHSTNQALHLQGLSTSLNLNNKAIAFMATGENSKAYMAYTQAVFERKVAEDRIGLRSKMRYNSDNYIDNMNSEILTQMGHDTEEKQKAYKQSFKEEESRNEAFYEFSKQISDDTVFSTRGLGNEYSERNLREKHQGVVFQGISQAYRTGQVSRELENITGIDGVANASQYVQNLSKRDQEMLGIVRNNEDTVKDNESKISDLQQEIQDLQTSFNPLLPGMTPEQAQKATETHREELNKRTQEINSIEKDIQVLLKENLSLTETSEGIKKSLLEISKPGTLASITGGIHSSYSNLIQSYFGGSTQKFNSANVTDVLDKIREMERYVEILLNEEGKSPQEIAQDKRVSTHILGLLSSLKEGHSNIKEFSMIMEAMQDKRYYKDVLKRILYVHGRPWLVRPPNASDNTGSLSIFNEEAWQDLKGLRLDDEAKAKLEEVKQRVDSGELSEYDVHRLMSNYYIMRDAIPAHYDKSMYSNAVQNEPIEDEIWDNIEEGTGKFNSEFEQSPKFQEILDNIVKKMTEGKVNTLSIRENSVFNNYRDKVDEGINKVIETRRTTLEEVVPDPIVDPSDTVEVTDKDLVESAVEVHEEEIKEAEEIHESAIKELKEVTGIEFDPSSAETVTSTTTTSSPVNNSNKENIPVKVGTPLLNLIQDLGAMPPGTSIFEQMKMIIGEKILSTFSNSPSNPEVPYLSFQGSPVFIVNMGHSKVAVTHSSKSGFVIVNAFESGKMVIESKPTTEEKKYLDVLNSLLGKNEIKEALDKVDSATMEVSTIDQINHLNSQLGLNPAPLDFAKEVQNNVEARREGLKENKAPSTSTTTTSTTGRSPLSDISHEALYQAAISSYNNLEQKKKDLKKQIEIKTKNLERTLGANKGSRAKRITLYKQLVAELKALGKSIEQSLPGSVNLIKEVERFLSEFKNIEEVKKVLDAAEKTLRLRGKSPSQLLKEAKAIVDSTFTFKTSEDLKKEAGAKVNEQIKAKLLKTLTDSLTASGTTWTPAQINTEVTSLFINYQKNNKAEIKQMQDASIKEQKSSEKAEYDKLVSIEKSKIQSSIANNVVISQVYKEFEDKLRQGIIAGATLRGETLTEKEIKDLINKELIKTTVSDELNTFIAPKKNEIFERSVKLLEGWINADSIIVRRAKELASYRALQGTIVTFGGREMSLFQVVEEKASMENDLLRPDSHLEEASEEDANESKVTFDDSASSRASDSSVLQNYEMVTYTENTNGETQISNLTPNGILDRLLPIGSVINGEEVLDYAISVNGVRESISKGLNTHIDGMSSGLENVKANIEITYKSGKTEVIQLRFDNSKRIIFDSNTAAIIQAHTSLRFRKVNKISGTAYYVLTDEVMGIEQSVDSDLPNANDIDYDASRSLAGATNSSKGSEVSHSADFLNDSYNKGLLNTFLRVKNTLVTGITYYGGSPSMGIQEKVQEFRKFKKFIKVYERLQAIGEQLESEEEVFTKDKRNTKFLNDQVEFNKLIGNVSQPLNKAFNAYLNSEQSPKDLAEFELIFENITKGNSKYDSFKSSIGIAKYVKDYNSFDKRSATYYATKQKLAREAEMITQESQASSLGSGSVITFTGFDSTLEAFAGAIIGLQYSFSNIRVNRKKGDPVNIKSINSLIESVEKTVSTTTEQTKLEKLEEAKKHFLNQMRVYVVDKKGNKVGLVKSGANSKLGSNGGVLELRNQMFEELEKRNFENVELTGMVKSNVGLNYLGVPNTSRNSKGEKNFFNFNLSEMVSEAKEYKIGYTLNGNTFYSDGSQVVTRHNYAGKLSSNPRYHNMRTPVLIFEKHNKLIAYPLNFNTSQPILDLMNQNKLDLTVSLDKILALKPAEDKTNSVNYSGIGGKFKNTERMMKQDVIEYVKALNDFITENGLNISPFTAQEYSKYTIPSIKEAIIQSNGIPSLNKVKDQQDAYEMLSTFFTIDVDLSNQPFIGTKIRMNYTDLAEKWDVRNNTTPTVSTAPSSATPSEDLSC